MKPRIYKEKDIWWFKYEDEYGIVHAQTYYHPSGAYLGLADELRKMHYRVNGMFMLKSLIKWELLTVREHKFCDRQLNEGCKYITKRQYGWLKGLEERTNKEK